MTARARAAFALALLLPLPAAASAPGELQRFALVAGSSRGGPGRAELRYAVADARRVAEVLRELAGVEPRDLLLLEEPDGAVLRGALARLAGEAARARAAGRRPELFVYYSGHSDEEALLLGRERLAYADLRRELQAVPAQVRVAILDSCASGAFTRRKGGQHRPPFLVDASQSLEGHAFLTSSAADEASQESDRLGASFFTHALLTGLRGAADRSGDGLVTLTEAYQFAFQETLAGTERTQAGPQHATYDIGLQGSGDVVLTDLRRAGATLVLPDGLAGRVFVRAASGALVAELRKAAGARTELGLEPGRYEVRVLREGRSARGEIALDPGARAVVEERSLLPEAVEATRRRGDGPEGAPAAPAPGQAGRRVLALELGVLGLAARSEVIAGQPVRVQGAASGLGGISFAAWLDERWALTLAVRYLAAQGTVSTSASGTAVSGAAVMPLLVGARYSLPLGSGEALFLDLDLALGGYLGMDSKVSTALPATSTTAFVETRPGARVGLGVAWQASRYFRLGAGVGGNAVASYGEAVGGRRNYSGLDGGISLGLSWGGAER